MEHSGESTEHESTGGGAGPESIQVSPPDKRMILEYTSDSPLKGMFQIMGLCPDPPPPALPGPFCVGSDEAPIVDFASFVRATSRAAYYREGKFEVEQAPNAETE